VIADFFINGVYWNLWSWIGVACIVFGNFFIIKGTKRRIHTDLFYYYDSDSMVDPGSFS